MNDRTSLPADYFERMFAETDDPWDFESSPYEAEKYNVTIAALGGGNYDSALEIGCANGVLTQRLAARCRLLLAIDVSATALQRAQKRCAHEPGVKLAEMSFPAQQPDGVFDLIVMSEVVYYWSDSDIAKAGAYVGSHLRSGGDLLLVHWTGETDYPQTGDGAVEQLRESARGFNIVRSDRYEKFRLDQWRRAWPP